MSESPSSDRVPARTASAVLVFGLCCLLSTARLVIDAPSPRDSPGDIARRSDQRFSALKAALPERGVVGYIGEPGIPALADYYLAQYSLAPLVIDHSPNHPLVIGNFPDSSSKNALPNDLKLVKDFGDGILLFANQVSAINKDEQ